MVGLAIDGAFAFALDVPLRFKLCLYIVLHGVELDAGASQLVAVIKLGQVCGRNLRKFIHIYLSVEIQITIREPLCKAQGAALVALRKTIEKHVVAMDGDGHVLRASRGHIEALCIVQAAEGVVGLGIE